MSDNLLSGLLALATAVGVMLWQVGGRPGPRAAHDHAGARDRARTAARDDPEPVDALRTSPASARSCTCTDESTPAPLPSPPACCWC